MTSADSYLFLKEKIHFKQDLALCQQDIYDFIFARIYAEDASVIPYLLQWLLLESEGLDIQHRLDAILSGETIAEEVYWTQIWDEDSSAYYYMSNSQTQEESVWEAPEEYFGVDEKWHTNCENSEELNSLETETTAKAEQAQTELEVQYSYTSILRRSDWQIQDIGTALEAALGLGDDETPKPDAKDVITIY